MRRVRLVCAIVVTLCAVVSRGQASTRPHGRHVQSAENEDG